MPREYSAPGSSANPGYHDWREASVAVDGVRYRLATKPGVLAFGRNDVASRMLAECVKVAPGEVVVQMHGATGLFAAHAARHATRVMTADRNVLSVEAARRTFAANGITNAEAFPGHGVRALPPGVVADVVVIRIPTEKLALHELLRDAFALTTAGGRCAIAGATNEGIKSAATTLEKLFGNAAVIETGDGHRVVMATKLNSAPRADALAHSPYLEAESFNEILAEVRGRSVMLFTRPGVFSWDHVDEASALLTEHMLVKHGDRVLDLGCGAGLLGIVAGGMSSGAPVTLVDADLEAVRCASRGVQRARLPNSRVLASDVASAVLSERFDVVVTNPPFHVGKATDLDVPLQFIQDAWHVLDAGGRLYLVANRTLPYEKVIFQRFGNIATLHDGRRFKVLSAVRQ